MKKEHKHVFGWLTPLNQPIAGGQDHLQTEINFAGTISYNKLGGSNSAALGLLGRTPV